MELDRQLAVGALLSFEGHLGPDFAEPAVRVQVGDVTAVRAYLDAMRGRFVLEHHWATWCEPCVDELPRIARAADAWRAAGLPIRVAFVCWDLLEDQDDDSDMIEQAIARVSGWLQQMAASEEVSCLLYSGDHEDLVAAMELPVLTIPQSALRDPTGLVLKRWPAPLSESEIAEIPSLLEPVAARRPRKPTSRQRS